jgi:hypothetical protein
MSESWSEQLDRKEKELNLKKEEINETKSVPKNRSNSGRSNNSNSISQTTSSPDNSTGNRSGDLFRGRIFSKTRPINNSKKGGSSMITVDGALKDLEAIETEATDAGSRAIIKALKVLVKFLSTMRSNQLLTDEEKVAIKKAKEARTAKEVKK